MKRSRESATTSKRADGTPPTAPSGADAGGGVEVAVLDRAGVIVSVNRAWQDFAADNDGDPVLTGAGVSYLAVCEAVTDDPDAVHAHQVAAAIRAAAAGELTLPVRVVIPCHSDRDLRWFEVVVSARLGDDGEPVGAIVTLAPTTTGPSGEPGTAGAEPSKAATRTAPLSGQEPEAPERRWQRSAAVLDAIPDGVVLVGAGGVMVAVNAELERLSGYRAVDLVGRPVEMLVPAEARGEHRGWHAQFAAAPTHRLMGHGGPLRLQRADGSMLSVEISLGPAVVDGQRLTVAAVRDLGPRRQLEQRLALVADLLDSIDDGVVVWDPATGQRVYANRTVTHRMHTTLEQLRDVPLGGAAGPEDQVRVQAAVHALTTGQADRVSIQVQIHPATLPSYPVEMMLTHRPDPAGAGPGLVVIVSRDISEQVAAQARLRASEQLFRALFEQSPVGLCVVGVDPAGRRQILHANRPAADLFGTPVADLVGMDVARFVPAEDEPTARQIALQVADDASSLGLRTLRRFQRSDGALVWAELHATRLRDTSWLASADQTRATGQHPDQTSTRTSTRTSTQDSTTGSAQGTAGGPAGEGPIVLLGHLVDVTDRVRQEERRARRARLAELVAQVSTRALAGQTVPDTYRQVVEGVAALMGAMHVALALPDPVTGQYRMAAGVGPGAAALDRGEITVNQDFVAGLAHWPKAQRFTAPPAAAAWMPGGVLGPCAGLPFQATSTQAGAMTLMRPPDGQDFDDEDLELLDLLGHQLALVVELGAARADTERLALLEERHRIARDLHDTVIQDLFAIGMQLDTQALRAARSAPHPAPRPDGDARAEEALDVGSSVLDQLDRAIRRLRGLVFDLAPAPDRPSLTHTVRAVVQDAGRVLGFEPVLALHGPIDDLPTSLADDLLAVLREALSNIARHASAHTAHVTVTLLTAPENQVHLSVRDDGIGISAAPGATRGHGLANITNRAHRHGGSATFSGNPPTGTRLDWTAPLPSPDGE